MNASDLVAEYFELKDKLDSAAKMFADRCKPFNDRMVQINSQLLDLLNQTGTESLKTDHGTAYKSTIATPKIIARDEYLDFVLDNWDEVGNEMLQLSTPQKDAVKNYMETHEGRLPPGVDQSSFTRLNIRRS